MENNTSRHTGKDKNIDPCRWERFEYPGRCELAPWHEELLTIMVAMGTMLQGLQNSCMGPAKHLYYVSAAHVAQCSWHPTHIDAPSHELINLLGAPRVEEL
eukprot:12851583-Alexandrium_andersonii.AAC.1